MLQFAYAIACFVLVYLVARVCCHIALRPWRAAAGQHWTQRARLLFPARVTAVYCLITLPMDAFIYANVINLHIVYTYDYWPPPLIAPWAVTLAALVAVILAGEAVSREIRPGTRFGQFTRSTAAFTLFKYSPMLVILAALVCMPGHFDTAAWVIAAVAAGVLIATQYGLMVAILGRLGLLKPADADLQQLVDDISGKMGIPVRRTWVLPSTLANAMALVVTREIVFTSALLEKLTRQQIAAICAHELGHLSESAQVRHRRQLASLLFFPLIFITPALAMGNTFLLYFIAWLFIAGVLGRRIRKMAREMETRADQMAAAVNTPADLARAMERLYEVNLMPAVIGRKRAVHPELYDRMTAAGITPDYARPLPPKRRSMLDNLLLAVLFFSVAIMTFQIQFHTSRDKRELRFTPQNQPWQTPNAVPNAGPQYNM